MDKIIDAAMDRSRTVLTFLVISIIGGIAAYISIPKEAEPDIQIPIAMVQMIYEGVSPEDAERLLIKPMEVQLRTLEGLEELQAFGSTGYAGIFMEFSMDMDMDQVLLDVREAVDQARAKIPQEAEEPIVQEVNFALQPVIIVTLSGDVPERMLYSLARSTKDEIESIQGILSADLMGQREELLEIVVDPAKLETYGITYRELFNVVAANNRLIPAGSLDNGQGSFDVKVPGLFESALDVYDLPLKVSGDGVVTLSDIADIKRTFKDRESYARVNGQPALGLAIRKRIGTNVIETNQAVMAKMEELQKTWPNAVKVNYVLDQSEFIDTAISGLQASIITAISLVMIVVVAALGLRSAFLVGLAIPTSFLLGFLMLSLGGFSVNNMVMFGMVLAVGILVDGAIVIVEYADRKMAEGQPKENAYRMAGKRMFWPIVSSTATTLAAFFPMLFWPGVSGEFMSYLPFTLIFVLTASLLVALIFLPVLGKFFGKTQMADSASLKVLAADEHIPISEMPGMTGQYARFVNKAIQTPGRFIALAIAIVIVIIGMFNSSNVKFLFFIDTDPQFATVQISARGNYSAEEKSHFINEVEDIVLSVDGVKVTFASTGGGGLTRSFDQPKDMIGSVFVELKHWKERRSGRKILDEIRSKTKDLAGIAVQVQKVEEGPPTGKAIQIELRTDYPELLPAATAKVRAYMEDNIEGLIEIDDSLPLPGIQYEVIVDREQAGRFGADITTVGTYVQLITNGILVARYRPNDADDEVDIRLRYPFDYRNLDQLDQLRIQTNHGLVPISNFVNIRASQSVDQVDRIDAKRIMKIQSNVATGHNTNEKVSQIRQWIEKDKPLDPRIFVKFRGGSEEQQESANFLALALFLSLFLMAMILITQFNNFYHSFLILSSVILSTIGVMLGIVVTGQSFSIIMTGTGIVALAGIVVNNNIVLIDTFQRLMKSGYELTDAIVHTAAQRLRPILLTTITTMFGLLPMALNMNIDYFAREVTFGSPSSLWWVNLSTAVIFGLGFSTMLTLFLTPCLLAAPKRLKEHTAILRGRFGQKTQAAE